ncbi:MAG: hypothetical protein AAB316_23345 [Bacteroidota bacterium]
MAKVTATSTKDNILQAYNDLADQLKEEHKENTALRQELEKKQRLLEQASTVSQSGAAMSVQQLRQSLNKQLEELENGLAQEQRKFEMLREAASTQQAMLDDLYKIKAEAESLEALVLANRQAKERLEREMEARRQQLEDEIKEVKMKWEREREDYDYTLKLKRRNEQDAYNEQKNKLEKDLQERKAAFEKSISDRERAVAEQEDELKRLRQEAAGFDDRLQKAVQAAEKAVAERLTREFDYKQKLEIKDLEAELKLREQMIQSLQNKVKEQQEMLSAMSVKTDSASQQVKDIALKAIEKSGVVPFQMERRREDKNSD